MKHPNSNIFAAWFFVLQTLAMGWVAAAGDVLLHMLGVPVQEGDIPGRIVGALLLFLAVFLVWHFRRGLPPQGDPAGKGFRFGHKLLLAGNVLAASLFVFQFFGSSIEGYNTKLVLDKFTTSFGYFAMGLFAVGVSFIYQSALPQEEKH